MLMIRNDQFPDVDRLARQLVGSASRPAVMPMDAWRNGDEAGVLVLRIPIAERAKPRKIEIGSGEGVQDTTAEERTSS